LMLDMGAEPSRFPNKKHGLMALYGRAVRMDRRFAVGFVRDITVISDEEYAAFAAPSTLQRFPDDLDDPNLEYSGIYEDGWASEAAFAILQAPATASRLRLQGLIPQIGEEVHTTNLTLLVDGIEVANRNLTPGEFTLQCQQSAQSGKHRIEVRASTTQRLPGPNNRPIAFQLRYLGFDPIAADTITGQRPGSPPSLDSR
jgi:hypothetical protein